MDKEIAAELAGIDLGDKRLNRRSAQIVEALAANPQASINSACSTWSDTIAAYRLLDNPAVSPERVLQPHIEATKRRMQNQSVVLVVQDTTELDYSKHPPKDAGCLNRVERLGLYDHTHLAITPERLCLGVVGQEQYDRTPESLGKARHGDGLETGIIFGRRVGIRGLGVTFSFGVCPWRASFRRLVYFRGVSSTPRASLVRVLPGFLRMA